MKQFKWFIDKNKNSVGSIKVVFKVNHKWLVIEMSLEN